MGQAKSHMKGQILSKKEKILELQYNVEALEDEVEHLQEVIAENHGKLWSVICDNDRLTLAFEPYIPEGDEDHGLTFYGLKEENETLTLDIMNKVAIIRQLQDRIDELVMPQRKKEYGGDICLDYWPPSDWLRLSINKWKPGRYWQLCVGPIRLEFFEA